MRLVIQNSRTKQFFRREHNGRRSWVASMSDATHYRIQPGATLYYMRKRGLSVRTMPDRTEQR